MNNESIEEKPLFEIPDYVYITPILAFLPATILLLIGGIYFYKTGNPYNLPRFILSGMVVTGISHIIYFLTSLYSITKGNKKIKFFTNRIERKFKNKTIYIENIDEIISISNLFGSVSQEGAIPNKLAENKKKNKILLLLLKFFVVLSLLFTIFPMANIPAIIFTILIYRKFVITSQLTPLNWKEDRGLPIIYPLPNREEQKKVKEYFNNYLNTDINQIKTTYI